MTHSDKQERRRGIDPVLDQVRSTQIEQGKMIAVLQNRVSNLVDDEKETHDRLDSQMNKLGDDVADIKTQLIHLNTKFATIPLGEHIQEHAFLKQLIEQAEAETKKKQAVSLFLTQEKIKLAKATAVGAFLICCGVGWFLLKYWFTNETGIEVPD